MFFEIWLMLVDNTEPERKADLMSTRTVVITLPLQRIYLTLQAKQMVAESCIGADCQLAIRRRKHPACKLKSTPSSKIAHT